MPVFFISQTGACHYANTAKTLCRVTLEQKIPIHMDNLPSELALAEAAVGSLYTLRQTKFLVSSFNKSYSLITTQGDLGPKFEAL